MERAELRGLVFGEVRTGRGMTAGRRCLCNNVLSGEWRKEGNLDKVRCSCVASNLFG